MECDIPVLENVFHGGCNGHLYNPPPLALVSAQAPRVPTPDPSFLVGCANETEPSVVAFVDTKHTAHLFTLVYVSFGMCVHVLTSYSS